MGNEKLDFTPVSLKSSSSSSQLKPIDDTVECVAIIDDAAECDAISGTLSDDGRDDAETYVHFSHAFASVPSPATAMTTMCEFSEVCEADLGEGAADKRWRRPEIFEDHAASTCARLRSYVSYHRGRPDEARCRANTRLTSACAPTSVRELRRYYASRPGLSEYTIQTELTRMNYEVVCVGGSVTLKGSKAVEEYYYGGDWRKDVDIGSSVGDKETRELLWRCGNQSILADVIISLTSESGPIIPSLDMTSLATSVRFILDFNHVRLYVMATMEVAIPSDCGLDGRAVIAELEVSVMFEPDGGEHTGKDGKAADGGCLQFKLNKITIPNAITERNLHAIAEGMERQRIGGAYDGGPCDAVWSYDFFRDSLLSSETLTCLENFCGKNVYSDMRNKREEPGS